MLVINKILTVVKAVIIRDDEQHVALACCASRQAQRNHKICYKETERCWHHFFMTFDLKIPEGFFYLIQKQNAFGSMEVGIRVHVRHWSAGRR